MSTPEILELKEQLDRAERDAVSLVAGLTDEAGMWRSEEQLWSVAQCLDHLTRFNGIYVETMRKAGDRARARGILRRRPAVPGFVGRWFLRSVEPPVKERSKFKAPGSIQPSQTISPGSALESFRLSQGEARKFLQRDSDLDLASIRFANPFIPGIRFSLATGLHILTAHERRHLWQAWRVRRAAEGGKVSV